jgi:hypothetical protein
MHFGEWAHSFYHKWIPPILLALLTAFVCAGRFFHLALPIGVYIAILGLLAGVVTVFPPETRWGKAGWIVVFFGLCVLEISNLYRDSGEVAEARRKEAETFSHLLDQEKEIMGQVTGDDGFAYFLVLAAPVDNGGASLVAIVHGKYAIRGLHYKVVEGRPPYLPTPRAMNEVIAGRDGYTLVGDLPASQGSIVNRIIRPPRDHDGYYTILLFALNGQVFETLETRYETTSGGARWNQKLSVKKSDGTIVLSQDWNH